MNPRVSHLHDLLCFTIEENTPLTLCNKKSYRNLTKRPIISYQYLKHSLFELGSIVKQKIMREMKFGGVGCISYDAWTRFNTHFVGIIAKYNKKGGAIGESLIGCSPMISGIPLEEYKKQNDQSEDDLVAEYLLEDGTKESVVFTAKAHAHHISEKLREFGVTVEDWLICQICDNTKTMPNTARLLNIYHVGCKSHKVHLCVKDSLTEKEDNTQNSFIVRTLKKVHETMRDARCKAKAGAALRNLTKLRPFIAVEDR